MPETPILPLREAERLALLRSYEVLDTPPERAFDDIAGIAAQLFGVPIALVSLVDECRQWFKANVGLDAPQTPREQAFCATAILSDDPLVVPDATADPRFADNPLVTGPPHIRFYAGAPLVAAEGLRLGSLCVIDTSPREASPPQLEALVALSRLVVDQLEHRQMNARLADAVARTKLVAELVPLCMHCRRVREEDKSYRRQLEGWLREQTGTEFSHGICADCREEHYGQF